MHALWISASLLAIAAGEPMRLEFQPVAGRPLIQSAAVKEASGLAISPADPGFMWILNDSGGDPELYLVGTDGSDRGKVTVKGTKNNDWEDLASFSLDGKNYLLVADAGDNDAKRDTCNLHILREPKLPAPGKTLASNFKPDRTIRFRFEGGPRDCESVAVDAKAGKIILISKRTHPPEVHELPLRPPAKSGILTTRKIGNIAVKSPANSLIPFRNQPTGLDITADGSLAAVVTYYGIFLFPRQPDESWAQAFAKEPSALPPHLLVQAESVAFSKDGKSVFAVSEGKRSPIARFQKRQPQ